MDENGNETFDADVALDKLRKVRTNSYSMEFCVILLLAYLVRNIIFPFALVRFDIEIDVCNIAAYHKGSYGTSQNGTPQHTLIWLTDQQGRLGKLALQWRL